MLVVNIRSLELPRNSPRIRQRCQRRQQPRASNTAPDTATTPRINTVLEAAAGGCSSTMAMSDPCPGFVASQWRIAANAGEPVPLYPMQMMLYSNVFGVYW
jgi:hypothetical protein